MKKLLDIQRVTLLSQTYQCGHKRKKPLSQRWHNCERCGIQAQRDLYSAFLARFVHEDRLDTPHALKAWAGAGNPIKMLPENPNMMYCYQSMSHQDDHIGKLRESFAVNQLRNAGHEVYYSRQGDYSVGKYHFEIGGKHKSAKQIDSKNNGYVLADGILVGHKNTIPLYLLGFLY